MNNPRIEFARKLRRAMLNAGWPDQPAVLMREFNKAHFGRPMTLHGVRRWLVGETWPRGAKLATLIQVLGVSAADLGAPAPPQPVASAMPSTKLDPQAIGYSVGEMAQAMMHLSVSQRRVLRDLIMVMLQSQHQEIAHE